MAEPPNNDPLLHPVVDALHDVHARHPIPPFEQAWEAARLGLEREPLHRPWWRPAAWRAWALASAAAAAGVTTVVAAVLWQSPPAGPTDHSRLPSQATSAMAPDLPARPRPVMWYAPTDELLRVGSLSYSARPALLVVYDPINLEVRP